jgi:hypothetical protein
MIQGVVDTTGVLLPGLRGAARMAQAGVQHCPSCEGPVLAYIGRSPYDHDARAELRLWPQITRARRKDRTRMVEPNGPGPGRSTSEAAMNELKKEIARRNEEAQKAGRKRRAEREKEYLANLRKWHRL